MLRAKHNDEAAIGIDLMITYVGIVIMMFVIGSTAVGMVEKMGQQTQHTALDANKEAGTKMIVVGAWVEDGYDDFLFMIEYQSQGKNVLAEDVEWVLWCVEDDDHPALPERHHRRLELWPLHSWRIRIHLGGRNGTERYNHRTRVWRSLLLRHRWRHKRCWHR